MREGYSLDGRNLETGRQERKSKRHGRHRRRKSVVVSPRAVVPAPNRHAGNDNSLEYRAPTAQGAKIISRNARATKKARASWDATFAKITKAGRRMG